MMLDGKAFGQEMASMVKYSIERATAPLLAEIESLKAAVSALPALEAIKDDVLSSARAMVDEAVAEIPVPRDGKDADHVEVSEAVSVEVAKAVAALPKPKDGTSVTLDDVAPLVAKAVAEAVKDIPKPQDGVGLAGALIDRQGDLVVTLTNGETRALGPVVGKSVTADEVAAQVKEEVAKIPVPADGRDGVGFDDMTVEHDGERGFAMRFERDGVVKEFAFTVPIVIDRGVWREGSFAKGDAVTWAGSLWIAQEDTTSKPETSKAWRLAVKRGKDGRDYVAPDKKERPPIRVAVPKDVN